MVAYRHYMQLAQSGDSEERGQAAHLAAKAYLSHRGPADERAALYAALMSFLDDPSVKVRAALAYGLLHAPQAPRPIMLALAQDAPVISRAVVQFSPVLLDSDLVGIVRGGDPDMLCVMTVRPALSTRVALALLALEDDDLVFRVLARKDVALPAETFANLGQVWGGDARLRGALLDRPDLPATVRMDLVGKVREALLGVRIVAGSIHKRRLDRILRDAGDKAMATIGEREAGLGRADFVTDIARHKRINTRLMLHALIHGQILFFADCLAQLAETPKAKVFTLLDGGSRAALNALFARCGFSESVRNLLARLVFHARSVDLADDVGARHYLVTLLIDELIDEHKGDIPPALDEAFAYLNEQNIALARASARGVMPAFAEDSPDLSMSGHEPAQLALPAA